MRTNEVGDAGKGSGISAYRYKQVCAGLIKISMDAYLKNPPLYQTTWRVVSTTLD